MSEPKFFVVRKFHDREHFSFEHGDFGGRYSKEERRRILYRAQLPDGDGASLSEAIAAYKRGVRMKVLPVPVVIPEPTRNPYKARFLAKLRGESLV